MDTDVIREIFDEYERVAGFKEAMEEMAEYFESRPYEIGEIVRNDCGSPGFYVGRGEVLAVCFAEGNLWLRPVSRSEPEEVSERILPDRGHLREFLDTGDVKGYLQRGRRSV